MVIFMTRNSSETDELLEQAAQGDQRGLGTLLGRHRDRLQRMVALRMDRRLQGRIDPSDVIQEAYLEASVRLAEYLRDPSMPFFLWLRFLAGQKLVTLHRHHLGVQMRDAEPGGGVVPGTVARSVVGRPGRPALGARHPSQRGGHPRRAEDPVQEASTAWTHSIAKCWPCATSSN